MSINIAVTTGEPGGIGPLLPPSLPVIDGVHWQLIGDRSLLNKLDARADCSIVHTCLPAANTPGSLNPDNAPYVIETLRIAAEGCLQGRYAAVVTAPVHKGIINQHGIDFSGHTEYFAEAAKAEVVMMLASDQLRMTLATTHIPLQKVSAALSAELLIKKIKIIHQALQDQFNIAKPHIAVLGLNPHAGEDGHIGREEIDILAPALAHCAALGITLSGPWPADTAFSPEKRQRVDAYLAMYHDQGLPVVKFDGFGQVVNITLGLPFIRTSVDHGTALELVNSANFSDQSFIKAATWAAKLALGQHV